MCHPGDVMPDVGEGEVWSDGDAGWGASDDDATTTASAPPPPDALIVVAFAVVAEEVCGGVGECVGSSSQSSEAEE